MIWYKGFIQYTIGNHTQTFEFNFFNPTRLSKQQIVERVENGYGVVLGSVPDENVHIETECENKFLREVSYADAKKIK